MYKQPEADKKPILITLCKLNDLVRGLSVTRQQSKLLASRAQEWNLFNEAARVIVFRKRSLS